MRKFILVIFLLTLAAFAGAQESGTAQVIPAEETQSQQEAESVSAGEETAAVNDDQTEDASSGDGAELTDESAEENADETFEEFIDRLPFFQRLAIAIGIILIQVLLIRLLWFLFNKLNIRLEQTGNEKIKPLYFHKYKILTAGQVISVIEVFFRLLKYFITIVLLYITLPIIFSLFSPTRNLSSVLFGYILNPIRDIIFSAVAYIPNLIKIIIFILITHYSLKALKYFADQIEKGRLKIPRFYAEWAAPTYRISQVLLWAFTVAFVYPYLPGSDSGAFQGVSVFVGVIFSLGSTTAIGNLVAGLVITYMRPFKLGDRVKIKDITGFVVAKNLMVVRLKTHKNEYVTFPNLIILGSNIINYNTSSDEDEEGLIIFAEVTVGYSVQWQTVHDILINAALITDHVQKKPKPFVLQTQLDDFYACYQINCYTKEVSRVPLIYTLLYENIQNGFRESGLDLTSAHYRVISKER